MFDNAIECFRWGPNFISRFDDGGSEIGPELFVSCWLIVLNSRYTSNTTRRALSQFWSFKIRRTTFPELHKIRRSTDFEALKIVEGLVGNTNRARQSPSTIETWQVTCRANSIYYFRLGGIEQFSAAHKYATEPNQTLQSF